MEDLREELSGPAIGLSPVGIVATPVPEAAVAAVEVKSDPSRRIAVVGEIHFAGAEVAAAIARRNMIPRVLCPDAASQKRLEALLPANSYEIVAGDLGNPAAIDQALNGTYGACFVSPITLSGRMYRPDTHLEDVSRLLRACEKNGLRGIAYHSSVAARPQSPSKALREAAKAEELIKASRCEEIRLSTGPIMGINDGFMSSIVPIARAASPFMGIFGYGGVLLQPLYVKDFATCMARVFDEKEPLSRGVYALTGPETHTWLELIDSVLERVGRVKMKFHTPLFAGRILGARAQEEAGLAAESFALEKSDIETVFGPGRLTDCEEVEHMLLAQ